MRRVFRTATRRFFDYEGLPVVEYTICREPGWLLVWRVHVAGTDPVHFSYPYDPSAWAPAKCGIGLENLTLEEARHVVEGTLLRYYRRPAYYVWPRLPINVHHN